MNKKKTELIKKTVDVLNELINEGVFIDGTLLEGGAAEYNFVDLDRINSVEAIANGKVVIAKWSFVIHGTRNVSTNVEYFSNEG